MRSLCVFCWTGMLKSTHFVPFQCSISCCGPYIVLRKPTAHASFPPMPVIALKRAGCHPLMRTGDVDVHDVPLKWSAMGAALFGSVVVVAKPAVQTFLLS